MIRKGSGPARLAVKGRMQEPQREGRLRRGKLYGTCTLLVGVGVLFIGLALPTASVADVDMPGSAAADQSAPSSTDVTSLSISAPPAAVNGSVGSYVTDTWSSDETLVLQP